MDRSISYNTAAFLLCRFEKSSTGVIRASLNRSGDEGPTLELVIHVLKDARGRFEGLLRSQESH
jgi:hypothetical protein